MLNKILFTAACLILPVVWGVVVNWMFNRWQGRVREKSNDEPLYPDYQI